MWPKQGQSYDPSLQLKVDTMGQGRIFGAGALLLLAPAAHAGFAINYTVTPGVDALAGKNVFKFYAKNDQTGEQLGSKSLLAMEITFQTQGQPFTFDFRDTDGDGQADANVFGKDFTEAAVPATFMRFGEYADWVSVLPAANKFSTKAGANPTANFTGQSTFQVTGFSQVKTLDATQDNGLFFGGAVVPAGVDVHVFGQMAAEKGGASGTGSSAAAADAAIALLAGPEATSAFVAAEAAAAVEQGKFVPVEVLATAPEPAAFGLLGLGALAGLSSRRRTRR
jgi:hypothetical protein